MLDREEEDEDEEEEVLCGKEDKARQGKIRVP